MITLLIRFHSGVKMLEKKQMKKPEYRVYAQETNVFAPWCYTELKGEDIVAALEKAKEEIAEEEAKEKAEKVNEEE